MKTFVHKFTLFVLALSIDLASAKNLTDKQARNAAAHIDSLITADLNAANLKPNRLIDEGDFLRRAYLGIIGRIPTEQECRSFFDNPSAKKREELIDSLVASPGFDSHLFNWTADLLRLQTRQEQFGLGWHVWLRKSLAEDKAWDDIVREMLSATGHASKDPAVGYFLRDRNMQLDNFSNTMQVFLGRQIGCAQCHDHPFDDWSQREYYEMAAFGGGFQYYSTDARDTVSKAAEDLRSNTNGEGKTGRLSREERQAMKNQTRVARNLLRPVFREFNKNSIFDNPAQSLKLPDDYAYKDAKPNSPIAPATLFGENVENVPPAQRREAFAKWVTSPENPYFTKVIVNRLWARTFGHGLLDPVDDWSEDSKPAHPEVLAFLETSMKAVDYDLRQFCKILFLTDLFQRQCNQTEPEPGIAHLAQGPSLTRMSAEQIYDSMLILIRGEIDDTPLAATEDRWEKYTESIEKLLAADTKELLILGESATQAEEAFRAFQNKLRALRKQLPDAKTAAERSQLMEKIRDTQKEAYSYRKERDPINMMVKEMTMTEMDMGVSGNDKRSGMRRRNANNKTASSRVSELPAPFNPGTLVREFGGSDRTTPSSGNTVPTAPQALALLNDPATDIVGGKRNAFNTGLSEIRSAEERLEYIFIRLYSRLPSLKEKEQFTSFTKDEKSLRDLSRAMLTSNQFIFIQ